MSKEAELQAIGEAAYEAIETMMKAVECDYERREELTDRMENDDPDDYLDDNELAELKGLDDEANGHDCEDEACQAIDEDPLSIQVRSGWHCPMDSSSAEEYVILLSTGGPATRIIGELDCFGQPDSSVLEAQDWFTPWTEYKGGRDGCLLDYAQRFYYGEGS